MEKPDTKSKKICPTCGHEFEAPGDPKLRPSHYPFCCDRCQWVDLGKWLMGQYRISEDPPPGDK